VPLKPKDTQREIDRFMAQPEARLTLMMLKTKRAEIRADAAANEESAAEYLVRLHDEERARKRAKGGES
jgi:hypothetical protein